MVVAVVVVGVVHALRLAHLLPFFDDQPTNFDRKQPIVHRPQATIGEES
jgi:hypothetical protein